MCARRSGWRNCARSWARKRVEPSFKHATPEYVRFEKPPVVERLEPVMLASGEKLVPADQVLRLRRHQRAAGVGVCRRLGRGWCIWRRAGYPVPSWSGRHNRSFAGGWRKSLPAIVRPYSDWLSEDYYIFLLTDVPGNPQGFDLLDAARTADRADIAWRAVAVGSQHQRRCGAVQRLLLSQ